MLHCPTILNNTHSNKCLAFLFFAFLFFQSTSLLAVESLPEDETKAALIYNILKNTYWPNDTQKPAITITFLGDNANLYKIFSGIAKEARIRNKQLITQSTNEIAANSHQDVIVVAPSYNPFLPKLVSRLNKTATLIITTQIDDKKLVMINFKKSSPNTIGFEVNKSNIIYEGLNVTSDILLNGGTEIEIATLYKELERSVLELKEQTTKAQNDLTSKNTVLEEKNTEISLLKEQVEKTNIELIKTKTEITLQQHKLDEITASSNSIATELSNNQTLLASREKELQTLANNIDKNNDTLATQQQQIRTQQVKVINSGKEVIQKNKTIFVLRNALIAGTAVLLFFLFIIIIRQRKALKNEHELLLTKNQLITSTIEKIAALESSSKLKNDFLLAITHEMRTPMHGILGASQTINPFSPEEVSNGIAIIKSSSIIMMDIIEKILTYSEILSSNMSNSPSAFNIKSFLAEKLSHYQQLCKNKNLTLLWETDNLPEFIWIDHKKLSKSINQLVDNAIKFTSNGGVEFSAYFHAEQQQLHLIIKDSGTGIAPELIEEMFTPFWQADSGLMRRYSGLGIGLTIAKSLIECMSGTIVTKNLQPNGCQFLVSIPTKIHTVDYSNIQPGSQNNLVLIVEDNIINQQVLQLMLKKLNYNTLLAQDGQQALEILEESMPCLILMDLQMPNMDGITCTRHIRSQTQGKQDIPIIAITANLLESQQMECLEAGMNDYLSKPIELHRLKLMLEHYAPLA